MICLLTERRLRPGTFDEFREAWEPVGDPPPSLIRAFHLRAIGDPDHVVSFGLFDLSRAQLDALRTDPDTAEEQRARAAAMGGFIEEIGVDGAFEVVEVVEGPSTGAEEDRALLA
ncbi:MAG: hypothetical protein QOD86_1619 [Miltoncostaeaceae bacterium]|jgi:hypothetical protein|nr:hypothetical protein [Miltoncostaeaceae bacterium]